MSPSSQSLMLWPRLSLLMRKPLIYSHIIQNKDASKPGDTSHVSDQSIDSLEIGGDDSFDRDDDDPDIQLKNISLNAEKRKPVSVAIDNTRRKDDKIKKDNQNILNYLDKSIAIDINKPKELIDEEIESVESRRQETDSDISLIESSNSLNLRFYESGKESSKL